MTKQRKPDKPEEPARDPASEKTDEQKTGAPAVAKEDVNPPLPGKKAKEASDAQPKKKPGSRLMDFTG